MSITGAQVAEIATTSANYLGYLAARAAIVSPAAGAEFTLAASAATNLAANTTECDTIALSVNTVADATTAVWAYLKNLGHDKAHAALEADGTD